jgi:uncharacterized phage protein (predicted DNA packaging)
VSIVSLESLKRYLRVDHSHDDVLLQELLDAAESQALSFLNADSFERVREVFATYFESSSEASTSEPVLPPDIPAAIRLFVRAEYDAEDASAMANLKDLAEAKLFPYRMELGA